MRTLIISLLVAFGLFDPPPALWDWPVSGPHRILRDFDAPDSPWGPGHRGIDIEVTSGRALLAPVSGRLRFQGEVVDRGVVTIETAEGHLVSMEPVSVDLPPGSRVRQGQIIGEVAPGHCRVYCLHLGLRINGEYHSPTVFLGYERRALLIPWPVDLDPST
jgi:murein DD-endopeptidase MepM/ murein hydrolase activator NlpD